jgi:hypothetical protein
VIGETGGIELMMSSNMSVRFIGGLPYITNDPA